MSKTSIDKRDKKKSDKPVQGWIGGRYEDCAAVLKIGDNYFGGFSGLTDAGGRSLTKIRNGLAGAKVIWGLAKVRDYARRLEDRGYDVKAYRISVDNEIEI